MNPWILHILPTTDRSVKIEHRLFEITLAITILVFLFWAIYGWMVGYGDYMQTVYISGGIIYGILYVLQKKQVAFRKVSLIYYYLILLILGISWFPSGGIRASVPTFLGLAYLSGLLVLPLKDYLIFIIATFGMVLGLTLYELYLPDTATSYLSEQLLIQDLAISTLISLAIMGISLYVFKRTYIDERRELRKRYQELKEEKHKAQSTDQAKTTFLATISHEMRTPLNGIVGMTELLSKTHMNDEQKDLIESLVYSSNILHGLISNVLDITTIEAGKLKLQMSSFNIREELMALWKVFEKKVSTNKHLVINLSIDENLPQRLQGDLPRIRQVLVNLLNNAIKFTYKGSIDLAASVVGQAGDVASVRFSIKDTGAGIPLENQPHLFETFYKATNDTKYEGTGLGLSIVEKLVSLMGGSIDFESTPQKGSHFYFTLPLGLSESAEYEQMSIADDPGLSDLNLLVVEDVPINRLVAQKMLKSIGISHIDLAINGTEGVKKAKEKCYDIILMDLQMPDISGFEASRQITNWYKDESSKPLIIALTANAMKSSREECMAAGMVDYILKPIKIEKLKAILLKYLKD